MSGPVRIQRKRLKGWKAPNGVVNVTRPGRWGNPFPVEIHGREEAVRLFRWMLLDASRCAANGYPKPAEFQRELCGKDLMCWCALDQACHADVLIEVANAPEVRA